MGRAEVAVKELAEENIKLEDDLKEATREFRQQFFDMEAELHGVRLKNKGLIKRNHKLGRDLHKDKEQHCKQVRDMEVELLTFGSENKNLAERNYKLKEKFNKTTGQLLEARFETENLARRNKKMRSSKSNIANRQYHQQFLNMEAELLVGRSENKKIEDDLKKQYCKQIHDMEAELLRARSQSKELAERSNKLEELHKAQEKEHCSTERNHEQTRNKLQEWCTTLAAMKEECDQVCKQQGYAVEAPQLSKKRKYVLKVYEINECVNCPICFEPWAQSGEHNVCSLSCGHFFGGSCITQWIKKSGSRSSSKCPLRSKKATLKEIRNHCVSETYAGDEEI
ncbi:protein SGM1-like [Cryptomeria japonica]|uniref:protein SGM1-like n=1 Tax=Cryptomeria japonica TaxID=3369 RepID=UPI0027DA72C9|nr:protein SGM1-like [Cryptomeria japonica]